MINTSKHMLRLPTEMEIKFWAIDLPICIFKGTPIASVCFQSKHLLQQVKDHNHNFESPL